MEAFGLARGSVRSRATLPPEPSLAQPPLAQHLALTHSPFARYPIPHARHPTPPSSPETPDLLTAALADRYRVERELGRGGMATVYLARDLRHDRPVALKVLRPELAASLGPERFLQEIRIAARLQHPHILAVHDSGEAAGRLWYTMPYVEGESLRQRIKREGQLPLDQAVRIASQVLSALGYAHAHGVIHRDIKPENILLEGDEAVVADFGVARAITAAGDDRLTETGLALGTPAYMSPEQAGASKELDGRSDLYAVGCVVYEMLAGQPPFTGVTAQQLLARHALDPVPPLRTGRATVPEAVEQTVLRALAKAPADRFRTAAEFAGALATPRETAVVSPPTPPRSRWRRTIALAAAGLALAAARLPLVAQAARRARPEPGGRRPVPGEGRGAGARLPARRHDRPGRRPADRRGRGAGGRPGLRHGRLAPRRGLAVGRSP